MANVFISIANCSSRHSASVGGAADGALFILHRKHTTRTRAAVACVSPIFLQHRPGLQWRVSLSFYNTDPARSGVCLTIFLQHGLGLQWCVSHYLSTTRTQPAELLGKKMKKSVSLGKNLARNTTVGALNIMRDFSQFCTLLWVISYIFIRDAGAPLRPRTRPGNMRTFVVIVTCQHPPDWASNYRKIGILYTPGFAELFRQIYLHLSMRKFNPMTNTFVCSLLLCLRIEHKKCKNASDDPETAKILFRQVTGYVWYD